MWVNNSTRGEECWKICKGVKGEVRVCLLEDFSSVELCEFLEIFY